MAAPSNRHVNLIRHIVVAQGLEQAYIADLLQIITVLKGRDNGCWKKAKRFAEIRFVQRTTERRSTSQTSRLFTAGHITYGIRALEPARIRQGSSRQAIVIIHGNDIVLFTSSSV